MTDIQIINPISYPDWDDLLLTHQDYSFFHTSAWAKVLSESYGYKPLYFTSIEGGRLSALIPVMEVSSFLTGRRGVSLPFTDFCEPIAPDETTFQEVVNRITEYGKKAGWKYIEWKGGQTCFQGIDPSQSYYGHTIALVQEEREIFACFRDSTKRNIRKAIKEDVKVKISSSLESLKAFCRLNCITRKHHGLPPQPFLFFKKVFEHIISKNLGFVVIASHTKQVIAGAVYLVFGDKAIFKYGASDRNYHHLRANNLVMWKAIKWSAHNGFKSLQLGRTEPENQGLLQFKRGWGAREEIISYFKYDLGEASFAKSDSQYHMYTNFLRKMPIPLLRAAGSLFYGHLG
jgi:hypothetical protein